MAKVIVFKNEDGGVSVVSVTEGTVIEEEKQKLIEDGYFEEDTCKIIDNSELPDREFRDAWEWVE